jgi:hypothetical protein
VEHGKENLIRTILDEPGADIETKDSQGSTALIKAAEHSRYQETKLLLRKRADINATNNLGETPLITGIKSRSTEIVTLLLARGVDAECKNNNGETPLLIASKMGLQEIVAELLERGVATEAGYVKGHAPADVAYRHGHFAVVQLLQTAENNRKPLLKRIFTKRTVFSPPQQRQMGESLGRTTSNPTRPAARRPTVTVPQRSTSVPLPEWTMGKNDIARLGREIETPRRRVWRAPIREEKSDDDDGEEDYEEFSEALFYERLEEEPTRMVES